MSDMAVIYARVSTKGQKDRGYSLGTQVERCQDYVRQKGFNLFETIEDDISGATRLEERIGGQQLLDLINGDLPVDNLIVWRLDRLSRPPEGEYSRLLTTLETLGRFGVTVHDCETGEVKTSMESIMIAFFKGLAASKERQDIVERSLRGRLAKAKDGKWIGQGWTPYGYRKIGLKDKSQLVIDESEAKVVRRIFDLFIGKHSRPESMKNIARILTEEGTPTPGRGGHGYGICWNRDHIRERILKRRAYIGKFEFAGVSIDLPDLAIVGHDVWDAAQTRLEQNRRRPRRKTPGIDYLMSGRIKCTCGASFTGFHTKNRGKVHRYYRCTRKTRYGRSICSEGNLNADLIDSEAWAWLVGVISNDSRLEDVIKDMQEQAELELQPCESELASVNALLVKTQQKIDRLMAAFGNEERPVVVEVLNSQIDESAKLIESLQRERDKLEAQIESTRVSPTLTNEINGLVRQVRTRLKEGRTFEDKHLLIEALLFEGRIFYEGDTRKLRLTCGLGRDAKDICINNHSCTRPV